MESILNRKELGWQTNHKNRKSMADIKEALLEKAKTAGALLHLALAVLGLMDTSDLDQELGSWENWNCIV